MSEIILENSSGLEGEIVDFVQILEDEESDDYGVPPLVALP
jgi:hypothetical protein